MGHGIAFVTHKLEEVMNVADRITVLRQGKAIATLKKQETSVQDLARLMIGRIPESDSPVTPSSAGNTILEVKNIHAMGDSKRPALNGLSLSLSAGEILGIAGVAGNGQRELAETLVGLRKVSGGHILFDGEPIALLSPRQILHLGMGYIPEDRLGVAGVPSLPVSENFILRDYTRQEFSGRFFLKPKWIDRNAAELIKTYNIKTPDANTPLGMLSGGNIQKVILAREISRNPKLLVAMNPTRGLDIGATETIHRTFLNQKRIGKAILLISEDLDELFALSDRIAVIYKGKIRGVVKADQSLVEDIGLMMGGAST
jgi:simple sugar transport system ATP-binding protein